MKKVKIRVFLLRQKIITLSTTTFVHPTYMLPVSLDCVVFCFSLSCVPYMLPVSLDCVVFCFSLSCVPYVASFSGLFLFCFSLSCVPNVASFSGLCCVLFVFVSCTLCCQFLWILHSWFPHQNSLTFINYSFFLQDCIKNKQK